MKWIKVYKNMTSSMSFKVAEYVGKMEDYLTSADPLSYATNGSWVRPVKVR